MSNYIIIGFMGSGKTTISKILAKRLGRKLLDSDRVIEEREGTTIRDMFEREGEDFFRKKETELLREWIKTVHNSVLSVGGGTPLNEDNQAILRELGTVIYLDVNANTVWKRLKGDTTRPLLNGPNAREKVETLLEKRRPVYEKVAQITIVCNDRKLEDIVDEICAVVETVSLYKNM